MKPFIVVTDGMDKEIFNRLTSMGEFDVHPSSKVTPSELEGLLPKMEGMVIRSTTQVTDELLTKAPQLKYVIRAGVGTDNIDKPACGKKDVAVSNVPGGNSNSAAELAVALMFSVLRKTSWAHQKLVEGGWDKSAFLGNELADKTIGIFGMGRVGQLLAKRLSGFDNRVLYFDPHASKKLDIPGGEAVDTIEKLFAESDIISLHCPLTPQTKNLVSQKLLSLMKPSAILINVARGGIVVEEDLLEVLQKKKIRGAGFDVFLTEPLESDSPFRRLDNIVLTPHIGASTQEAQERVGEACLHQLKEFFVNKNLINEVR
jgi:D-3-phosphoglycerate dehydrogenase